MNSTAFLEISQKYLYKIYCSNVSLGTRYTAMVSTAPLDDDNPLPLVSVIAPPVVRDPAPPAKRKSSPWLGNRVDAPVSTMQGAIPPEHGIPHFVSHINVEGKYRYGITG